MKRFGLFLVFTAMFVAMTMPALAQSDEMNDLFKRYVAADKEQKAIVGQELETMAYNIWKANKTQECRDFGTLCYEYIDNTDNIEDNLFMISLFKYVGNYKDIDRLNKYADNDCYADATIRTMAEIPAYAEHLNKLIIVSGGNLDHKNAYAYAIGRLKMVDQESLLLSWLKGADDYLKLEINNALLRMGSSEAMLVADKGAKKLYKKKDVVLKIGGMKILAQTEGDKAMPYFYKALKNKDVNVRRTALELMKPYANEEMTAYVVKKYAKKDVTADIVWWIGELYDKSQAQFLVAQLSSDNPKVVEEAIRAVFKIENQEGLNVVKTMFGGQYQPVIKETMTLTSSDVSSILKDAMQGDDHKKLCALEILAEKRCPTLFSDVMNLIKSDNPEIKDAAYKALKNVAVGSQGEVLRNLMESCEEKYVEDVQDAIIIAMRKAKTKQIDNFLNNIKKDSPEIMSRFYKIFVSFNTETSINKLVECYHLGYNKEKAVEALMLIEDPTYVNVFQELVNENDEYCERFDNKYHSLINEKK